MREVDEILKKMSSIVFGSREENLYSTYPPKNKTQEALNAYSKGYEDGTYNFYNSISKLIFDIKYKNGWVYTEDDYPRCEQNVLVLTDEGTITTAIYEDGTICEEDSDWFWDGLDINGKYDDECQCMIIPEGWYEYRNFNSEGVYNNKINENVIAWQILPRYHIPGYVTMHHMQWYDGGDKYVCELTDELDKIVFDTKHKVVHHYVYVLDRCDKTHIIRIPGHSLGYISIDNDGKISKVWIINTDGFCDLYPEDIVDDKLSKYIGNQIRYCN